MTTTITDRDREVSEQCRNSGSRAERDAIIASYRAECEQRGPQLVEVKPVYDERFEQTTAWLNAMDGDSYVTEAWEERAARAERKLARIRKLVTHDKPLIGEQPGCPRFVVKGCEVLAVLDGEEP